MTDHVRSVGGRPWKYLLVPQDQVTEDETLAGFFVFKWSFSEWQVQFLRSMGAFIQTRRQRERQQAGAKRATLGVLTRWNAPC